jgi:serine/threonine protein kinase
LNKDFVLVYRWLSASLGLLEAEHNRPYKLLINLEFLKMVYPDRPKDPAKRVYRKWTGYRPLPEYEFLYAVQESKRGLTEVWKDLRNKSVVVAKIMTEPYFAENIETALTKIQTRWTTSTRHPQIIQYLGAAEGPYEGERTVLVEYCELGDLATLKDAVSRKQHSVSELDLWSIFYQLCEAARFLHTGTGIEDNTGDGILKRLSGYANGGGVRALKGKKQTISIIHRDINPRNVLLNRGKSARFPDVRLADFGMAIKYKPGEKTISFHGEEGFRPPPCDWPTWRPASDIWGIGAVIHYLACGVPPIDRKVVWMEMPRHTAELHKDPRIRRPMSDTGEELQDHSPTYSKELCEAIYSALTTDIVQRATADELIHKIRAYWADRLHQGGLTKDELDLVRNVIRVEEEAEDNFMLV